MIGRIYITRHYMIDPDSGKSPDEGMLTALIPHTASTFPNRANARPLLMDLAPTALPTYLGNARRNRELRFGHPFIHPVPTKTTSRRDNRAEWTGLSGTRGESRAALLMMR